MNFFHIEVITNMHFFMNNKNDLHYVENVLLFLTQSNQVHRIKHKNMTNINIVKHCVKFMLMTFNVMLYVMHYIFPSVYDSIFMTALSAAILKRKHDAKTSRKIHFTNELE